MKEGNNGVVAADDKAALPKEGVVTPEVEASRETAVELAVPNKGDSGNDCAVATEEETEDNTPKEGKGAEAVDDPNPKKGDDEPPPILGFEKEEVAGAAADMEDEIFKENDEAGPEEKLKVDVGGEEMDVTEAVAGVEIELEYENGLVVDDAAKILLVAAIDELGFDERLKRNDEELEGKVVEEEEELIGLDCEAEATAEPKEKEGVWLADAAVAAEDEKIGEAAEEKENGEDDDAKELEVREKENPGDWEDDEEAAAEGLKEKDDAIQIQDGLLPRFRSQPVSSFPKTEGDGIGGYNIRGAFSHGLNV